MLRLDNQFPFKSVILRTKVFFRKWQWKETLTFLFFVLLSAGFWYLQSLQQDFEMEIVLPVKYKNVPADMILSENNPEVVVFKVKDKGLALLNYSWLYTFAPLEVNLKSLRENRKQEIRVTEKTIESNISKQLIASTSLLGFEPQSFQVQYVELLNKELPVIADVSVSPDPGFQISGSITVTPARVHVYASSAILDTLSALKTESVELKKVNQTKEITLRLQKIAGVQIDEDKVKVLVPIEEFTEKRLTVPVLCKDLPESYTLHTFPASIDVLCNIPMSRFKELTESDFEIQIPFREFEANRVSGKVAVCLSKQPDWIAPPTLSPDTVEFILEQNTAP
ncbi:MAG: YbbR-like domain-containing protein [Tannerella sp.]|jgi:hypothetical protein|nr:YbbR-like domain-containing protein [Tannerella sp.]